VFAECREHHEPLLGQIGDRMRDAEVALLPNRNDGTLCADPPP
jgi:hypothetical protein